MRNNPNRADGKSRFRRIQFRLTTWFVLVGILAWAMWQPPIMRFRIGSDGSLVRAYDWLNTSRADEDYFFPNAYFIFPVLALAAFVGWKGFWLLRNRRQQH